MKLPKKLDPCPIVDAILEVRFSSKINPNAVFGVIYNTLQKEFPKVETLPILQFPDAVRAGDANLKHKPYYRISNDEFVVQIGPDVFTISSFPIYKGWSTFSNLIFDVIKKIEHTNTIQSVERLGIRYINFFEANIFDNIDLKVSIKKEAIRYKNTVVRTDIEQRPFISTLQIANNVNLKGRFGSIIDIDTHTGLGLNMLFPNKEEIINAGHSKEKDLFFGLLKPEFLKSFNPKF